MNKLHDRSIAMPRSMAPLRQPPHIAINPARANDVNDGCHARLIEPSLLQDRGRDAFERHMRRNIANRSAGAGQLGCAKHNTG